MRQILPFGKFYGENRFEIKTQAYSFAEVEGFAHGEVPDHTHENAHFLFVIRGAYKARVRDRKQVCHSSTMLYYPAGTTHNDHFYTSGKRFLTVSLTSEINKKFLSEINFYDYSLNFKNSEIIYSEKKCAENFGHLTICLQLL